MNFDKEVYDKVISGEGILMYREDQHTTYFYKLNGTFHLTSYIDELEITETNDKIIEDTKDCPIAFIKDNYLEDNFILRNYEKIMKTRKGQSYRFVYFNDMYLFNCNGEIYSFDKEYTPKSLDRLKIEDTTEDDFLGDSEHLLIHDLEETLIGSCKLFRDFIEKNSLPPK